MMPVVPGHVGRRASRTVRSRGEVARARAARHRGDLSSRGPSRGTRGGGRARRGRVRPDQARRGGKGGREDRVDEGSRPPVRSVFDKLQERAVRPAPSVSFRLPRQPSRGQAENTRALPGTLTRVMHWIGTRRSRCTSTLTSTPTRMSTSTRTGRGTATLTRTSTCTTTPTRRATSSGTITSTSRSTPERITATRTEGPAKPASAGAPAPDGRADAERGDQREHCA